MAQPTLTATGQRMYDAVAPLARDVDEALGWPLAYYCGALATMFDQVADLASDQPDGSPGWSTLFNPDVAPATFLSWVGQFVGVQMPAALNVTAQRLRLKSLDGFKRGTPDAIKAAAQQQLTGTKDVTLFERTKADGTADAYYFIVATYAAETPNPAAVLAALTDQKPAGLVMTYRTDPGWSVGQFEAAYASGHVSNAEADYASVGALEGHLP